MKRLKEDIVNEPNCGFSITEKQKITRYLEASEKMILIMEDDVNIDSPIDYFEKEEKKIFELFEKDFGSKFPYIFGKILSYFINYNQGELPKKYEMQSEYRNNVLENIDYFKFKHQIKTSYKHPGSPFN